MTPRIARTTILLIPILALALILAPCSTVRADDTVDLSINDVPVKLAIKLLFSSPGAPSGATYTFGSSVPEDVLVTLSVRNAPFDAALDALCQGAGLRYTENNGRFTFSRSDRRVSNISISRVGDKVTWKLRDAAPLEVLVQLIDVFGKKLDVKLDRDPVPELEEQARRYAEELQAISEVHPLEQANRTKDLQKDAERFVKPPKAVSPGTQKSLSAEDTALPFPEALDTLGDAGGFLWFRGPENKILVRKTVPQNTVKQIFQKENVWDALQK